MRVSIRNGVLAAVLCFLLGAIAVPAAADLVLLPEDISWETVGDDVVFEFRFRNDGPSPTDWSVCQAFSQPFGAYLENFGLIGTNYDIPPIPPDSFFDVVVPIPKTELPPSAEKILPGGPMAPGVQEVAANECPPDAHWDGNVDVVYSGLTGGGNTLRHVGTLQAIPGGQCSRIHITTNCPFNTGWTVSGLCPGFSVTLYDEDQVTLASNPVASGWSGWVEVCADATVALGTQCCFKVSFTCFLTTVDVDLCTLACSLGSTAVEPTTWGRIKVMYD